LHGTRPWHPALDPSSPIVDELRVLSRFAGDDFGMVPGTTSLGAERCLDHTAP
jgi:hypothetical protein